MSQQAPSVTREPPAHELAAQFVVQVAGLLGQEVALARAELGANARNMGTGTALFSVAAVLGLSAWLALVAGTIAGIAVALPVWAAALIVAGGLGLLASGILALAGRRMSRAFPPLPLTTDSIRRDLAEMKERAAR
jgi:Putative Actinobacterial Holin-X, holin superfamily III